MVTHLSLYCSITNLFIFYVDKEYLAFLEEREKPKDSITNAEAVLEKKLQEDAKLLSMIDFRNQYYTIC